MARSHAPKPASAPENFANAASTPQFWWSSYSLAACIAIDRADFEPDPGIRQRVRDGLVLSDGLVEHNALFGILRRRFQEPCPMMGSGGNRQKWTAKAPLAPAPEAAISCIMTPDSVMPDVGPAIGRAGDAHRAQIGV